VKPLIVYCYDAYCGWCYGFSPVIRRLWQEYHDRLDFEVLSGGMVIQDKPSHIAVTAPYIQSAYKQVEELTGIRFGQDYLWHIFNPDESDWYPSSEKPSIALCIIKDLQPHNAVPFASDLQYSLHFEGRDLCDDEAYRHLLERYHIEPDEFYRLLHSDEYKQKAYYDFALCKQLKVTGFPTVFIQASELKFYLVAKGFTTYEDLSLRVENVLKEIATTQNIQTT
jgi:putative protein-disulfide isomerase